MTDIVDPFDAHPSGIVDPFDPAFKKPAASKVDLAAPLGSEGFLGGVADVGRGLAHGVISDFPQAIGQAATFFGAPGTGKVIEDFGKAQDAAHPELRKSVVGQVAAENSDTGLSLRGNAYEGGSNAPLSEGPGVIGAGVGALIGSAIAPGPGTLAGAGLGYVAGKLASLPLFYGSQGQQSYEAIKKGQLASGASEADAESAARAGGHASGAIEAGGELLGDVIPFHAIAKPFIKPVEGALVRSTLSGSLKRALTNFGKMELAENATEMAQQAGEAQVEKAFGSGGEGATLKDTLSVVVPTTLMTLVPGLAAGVHTVRTVGAARAALADPDAPAEQRAAAAALVFENIKKANPDTASAFDRYAALQIEQGQPIATDKDDAFYHQAVDARPLSDAPARVPQAPLALPAPGPIPATPTVDYEGQRAADAHAAFIYAAREAEEQRLREVGASVGLDPTAGPLSRAGTIAVDSGATTPPAAGPMANNAAGKAATPNSGATGSTVGVAPAGPLSTSLRSIPYVSQDAAELYAARRTRETGEAHVAQPHLEQPNRFGVYRQAALDAQAQGEQASTDAQKAAAKVTADAQKAGDKARTSELKAAEAAANPEPVKPGETAEPGPTKAETKVHTAALDAQIEQQQAHADTLRASDHPDDAARAKALDRDIARLEDARDDLTTTTKGESNAASDQGEAAAPVHGADENVTAHPQAGEATGAAAGGEAEVAPTVPAEAPAETDTTGETAKTGPKTADLGTPRPQTGEKPDIAPTTDALAHEAATSPTNDKPEPTGPQIEAGNYAKGHLKVGPLDISIENPEGSTRRSRPGVTPAWETKLARAHYGYIRGSVGADKDHIDAFVKPGTPADYAGAAFVIDQTKSADREDFDEHKVMLGYGSKLEAIAAYKANYPKGHFVGDVHGPVTLNYLNAWLKSPDETETKRPFGLRNDALDQRTKQIQLEQRRAADIEAAKKLAKGDRVSFKQEYTDNVHVGTITDLKFFADTGGVRVKDDRGGDWTVNASKLTKLGGNAIAEAKAAADAAKAKAKALKQAVRTAQLDLYHAIRDNAEFRTLHALARPRAAERLATLLADFKARESEGADAMRKDALGQIGVTPDLFDALIKESAKLDARLTREEAKKPPEPKKLQNTGDDLRRHWELVKAELKAKNDAEGVTGMNRILAETTRADLFRDLPGEGATPGTQRYVETVRDQVRTFKDWLFEKGPLEKLSFWDRMSGDEKLERFMRGQKTLGYANSWRGIIPDETLDTDGWDPASVTVQNRLDLLRNAADTYLAQTRLLTDALRGATTVKEAAERVTERIWSAAGYDPKNLGRWRALQDEHVTPAGKALRESGVIIPEEAARMHARGGTVAQLLGDENKVYSQADRKQPLIPPRLLDTNRVGLPEVRKGDVTPAHLKAEFGFADIGFGSWVAAKEDQANLNLAWDSFADLARHLGVNPKAIGFFGQLHFTIGALGHGAKAAATFHPAHPGPNGTVQVINLTKTRGDGTVAHEWGHALDHFLSRTPEGRAAMQAVVRALKVKYDFERVRQAAIAGLKGNSWIRGQRRDGPVERAAALVDYYAASRGRGTSDYKEQADKLDPKYWGNDAELFARAWESWVYDHLGGANPYLVNPWVADGVTGPPTYRGTPFPRGDERKRFALWMTALVTSLRTDGALALDKVAFDRAQPDDEQQWRDSIAALKADLALMYEQMQLEEAAKVAQAERERAAAAQATRDAAEAERREQEAKNRPVPTLPQDTALGEDDLETLFDAAADDVRAEAREDAQAPEPGEPALNGDATVSTSRKHGEPPKVSGRVPDKAGALIVEAAKQGVKGIDEALKGLTKLFGGGKIQSFPGGLDEATYKEAKPHFEAALRAFQAAGKNLKDLFALLIRQFGEGVKPYAIRFAQEQKLTATLGEQPSATKQVAEWMYEKLARRQTISSIELFGKATEAFGGTQADGKYSVKDAYDAAEAGMNLWIKGNPDALSLNRTPAEARNALALLKSYTEQLPTQTKRTQEMDEFQQFSTVPALAYMANWVANVRPGETMLEPSAGIGGLAVFAHNAGAVVVANELSSRRAAVLREVLPDARVFTENAEQLDNVLPDDVKPTVIVMNPPFSATAGRVEGSRDNRNGARHIEQALGRLQPGGRLVVITGRGMDFSYPGMKRWWDGIKAAHNVRANLSLNGAEYAKYGTAFDNQLIVIDKTGPTTNDIVTGRVEAYADLPALLEGVRNDRHQPRRSDLALERPAAEQGGGEAVAGGLDQSGATPPADAGGVGSGQRDHGGDTGSRPDDGRDQQPGVPPATGGSATGDGPARGGKSTGRGRARRDDTAPSGDDGARSDPGSARGELTLDASGAARRDRELTDAIFEAYVPEKAKVEGSKPHPGKLVESAAMASVEPIDVDYTPNLPKASITSGALSAAQIEPVIYAGQAHQQQLPDGARRGFFIGDGTGVGKGREIAGIILDNQRQGRKKHVWLSAKSGLFVDAQRDLEGAGGNPEHLFQLGDTSAKDSVKAKSGILFTTYDTLRGGEKREPGAGFKVGAPVHIEDAAGGWSLVKIDPKKLEVTVERNGKESTVKASDVISIAGNRNWLDVVRAQKVRTRLDQLIEWVGADFDGVIAFDEAHKMGNLGGTKGARGEKEASQMALAGLDLQTRLPQARVVYVSATGATEVANLMYAARLGLWGANTAFATPSAFHQNISAAGLASMELVARDLKAQGSYIARSLSYDGVEYEKLTAPLSPLQTEIYDELALTWQMVLKNIRGALEMTGQHKNGNAKGAAMGRFWSTHQRFFNQVITSMQTPAIIDHAQKSLADGKAVVFQLVNTNEATQERLVKNAEAEGQALEELDFSPRQTLIDYVTNGYPIQQHTLVSDASGNVRSVPAVDSKGEPIVSKAALAARDALIAKLQDIRVPDNPIDLIIEALGEKNTGEVTGRGRRFIKTINRDGSFSLAEQKRGSASNRVDAQAFMDDKKKALIFSDAGGTGYSFQSDLGAKNQRQRVHYLVQPGWRADNAVQGFGRTHRSNEANQPLYVLPQTNLKAQKRFISSIARRLDQLGALTKGQRNTSSQGLFSNRDNLESKYATAALHSLIQDLAPGSKAETSIENKAAVIEAMGFGELYDPKTGGVVEGKMPPVTQFLNRLLSLTTAQQDQVFGEFEQRMDAAIDHAIETGTFDDGMQTVKALAVKKLRDETVHVDERTKAATRYVELELTQATTLNAWEDAQNELATRAGKGISYHIDNQTGAPFAVIDQGSRVGANGAVIHRGYRVNVVAPSLAQRGIYIQNLDSIKNGGGARIFTQEGEDGRPLEKRGTRYETITKDTAQYLWGDSYDAAPKTRTEKLNLLTGVLLPVWDRIQTGDGTPASVVRTQTDDGERFIGRVLTDEQRPLILKNFGVGAIAADTPAAELMGRVLGGEAAQLSNGWLLRKARVANEDRIEIKASYLSPSEMKLLVSQGAFVERIGYQERVFIPRNADTFEALTRGANRPVVDFVGAPEARNVVEPPETAATRAGYTVEPPFYSALARALDTKAPFAKDGTAQPGQLRMWLAARSKDGTFKPDELTWSGLDEWLSIQTGKVAKADVAAFLEQNGVKVAETMLGGDVAQGESQNREIDRLTVELTARGVQPEIDMDGYLTSATYQGNLYLHTDGVWEGGDGEDLRLPTDLAEMLDRVQSLRADVANLDIDEPGGTRYSSYTLPGGENYRELLLTLPEREGGERGPRGWGDTHGGTHDTANFRSSHFSEPNILAHIRFDDRTDADGQKVLFIEEFQSDWAQKGRRSGFKDEPARAAFAKWAIEKGFVQEPDGERRTRIAERFVEANFGNGSYWSQFRSETGKSFDVPAAPFVQKTEAWLALALKRMIRYAAEHGYDRVAWTNGEQQADRYDLSKHVSTVDVMRLSDINGNIVPGQLWVDAYPHGSNRAVVHKQVPENELADVIGKYLAARALKDLEAQPHGTRGEAVTYSGLDLKIGGEGMRAFYDKIVPNVANDLLKKLGGGKVSTVPITLEGIRKHGDEYKASNLGDSHLAQPGLDITQSMRTAVLRGQPLFAREMDFGTVERAPQPRAQSVEGKIGGEPPRMLRDLEDVRALTPKEENVVAFAIRSMFALGVPDGVMQNLPPIGVHPANRPNGDRNGDASYWPSENAITIRESVLEAILNGDSDWANRLPALLAHEFGHRIDFPVGGNLGTATSARSSLLNVTDVGGRRIPRGPIMAEVVRAFLDGDPAMRKFLRYPMVHWTYNIGDVEHQQMLQSEVFAQLWRAYHTNPALLAREMPKSYALMKEIRDGIQPGTGLDGARQAVRRALRVADPEARAGLGHADRAAGVAGAGSLAVRNATEGLDGTGDGRVLDRFSQGVADLLKSPRQFNPVLKNFQTQYHKAETNAHFKPVFVSAQAYLRDVSRFATDAADQALTLLPRLGRMADIFRRGPKQADVRAAGNATFAATLGDVRPSDSELRAGMTIPVRYGDTIGAIDVAPLTDAQLKLYHQARNAIDLSLDQVATSEATKLGRGEKIENALKAAKDDPVNGTQIIADALWERADVLDRLGAHAEGTRTRSLSKQVQALGEKAAELKAKGYAPLMRFGQFTVDVVQTVNGKPERVYFSMFETKREAYAREREMKALYPDAFVTVGTMDQEQWKLYQGLSLDSLAAFAETTGYAHDPLFQDFYKLALSSRSALKRMIHRNGIAGYNEDLQRVLASFVTSQARLASKNYHFGEMVRAATAIPNQLGDVRTEAAKLVQYVQNPVDEASKFRSLLFINFLGGSVASALTNMTQPVMMTLPYLSRYSNPAVALKELLASAKAAVSGGVVADPALREALDRASREGITDPQELHQLYADSIRGLGRNLAVRKGLKVWGSMFSLAESFNRRTTFIAAFRIAQGLSSEQLAAAGVSNAFDFAEKAVEDTQGIYNRGNRPNAARGALGATVFTFKQFSIAYLEFFSRLPPREKALAAALLVAAAGVQGAPGADDLADLLDTIGQLLGFNTNTKQALREWAARELGAFGSFLVTGVSGIPGVPLDVQGRLGFQNLIPGTGLFKRSEVDKTQEVAQFFGPAGGLYQEAAQAFNALVAGNTKGAIQAGAPVAIRNAMQGVDMWTSGEYKDSRGRKVIDTTPTDAVLKFLGIQPEDVAQASRKAQDVRQDVAMVRTVETGIADQLARAALDHDDVARAKALTTLQEWNQRNPAWPIVINPGQIRQRIQQALMERETRQLKAAPKEVRGTVLQQLRE